MLQKIKRKRKEVLNPDQLANTTWPMIHCDAQGTKTSPNSGPTQKDATTVLAELSTDVILMLSTKNRIYVQEAENYVKAFHPETLELMEQSESLEATFPFFAGGTLESNGNMWFTANNRVARLSPDLKEVIWSESFEPADLPFNTCCFLPDGNLLVTSCLAAHVISPELKNGTFEIISSLDLGALRWEGEQVFVYYPVMPRPVSDEDGGLYFSSNGFVSKLHYDSKSKSILPEILWAVPHDEDDVSFNLCDPVLVDSNVYAVAKPSDTEAMKVYSIDSTTGNLIGTCIPFPEAIGYVSAHTIGAVAEKNMLIVICQTPDLTGGMVGIDATTLNVLWQAPLANIGGAFCCSSVSNRAYIINRDSNDSMLRYWAIDLDNGAQTVLHQYPSDTDPSVSLASIGYDGRLYYPNPTPGFAMIQDK